VNKYTKTPLKIALIGLFLVCLGVFISPNVSNAMQSETSFSLDINSSPCGSNDFGGCFPTPLTGSLTASSSVFSITDVSAYIERSNSNNCSGANNFYMVFYATSTPTSEGDIIASSTNAVQLGCETASSTEEWIFSGETISSDSFVGFIPIGLYGYTYMVQAGTHFSISNIQGDENESLEPTISITVPQNGTSLGYFTNWEFQTYNIQGVTSTEDLYVTIRRATSSTSTSFVDDSIHFPLLSSGGSIPRSGILEDGTYYAQAVVLRGGDDPQVDEILVSSEIISWTSDGDLAGFYPPITGTTTISSSTIECNSGNLIGDGFCLVLKYAFSPSQDSLDSWRGLWDTIKNKPPMGYLVVFLDEIDELGVTTSTTSTYELPDLSGISLFDELKVGVGGLLILLTMFYVVRRFKHIKI